MLHPATSFLFPSFPREIGISEQKPFRFFVKSSLQFKRKFEKYSCTNDFYINISSADNEVATIFYDFDSKSDLNLALEESKKLFSSLLDYGEPIPVASAYKGFHIFFPIKKTLIGGSIAKNFYRQLSLFFVEKTFKEHPLSLDFHVVGDVNRLCRVQNTINQKSGKWCVFLPQDEFLDMKIDDVEEFISQPNKIDVKTKRFRDFYKIGLDKHLKERDRLIIDTTKHSLKIPPEPDYFKPLLRPLVFEWILKKNPPHIIRVTATIELLKAGIHPNSVYNFYKSLRWNDWNSDITRRQIEHILGKINEYRPYSIKKIKKVLGVKT